VTRYSARTRIIGIVAGTILLELINNGLTTLQINSNYTNIVLGCVLEPEVE
jgi:ribose transport system permease protein